jgi:uncharacterized membrane protein
MAGRPDLMPAITASVAIVLALLALARSRSGVAQAACAATIVAVLALWRFAPAWLLFLAPAAISFAVGLWFACSLLPGREPRITAYARREQQDELPPDVALYTRRLTLAWALLPFALGATGLALAVFAPLVVWSTFTNVVSYLILAGFFAGEYAWRRLRFPGHRHVSFAAHVRNRIARR